MTKKEKLIVYRLKQMILESEDTVKEYINRPYSKFEVVTLLINLRLLNKIQKLINEIERGK